MKVILAAGQYPPTISGVARLAHSLHKELQDLGHDVILLTENSGCKRVGRVARLDASGRRIIDQGADVLQVIGPTPLFTEQCVLYGRSRGVPVVFRVDSLPGLRTFYDNHFARAVDRLYSETVLRLAISRSNAAVFATGDLAQNEFKRAVAYEVIPNGIQLCDCLVDSSDMRLTRDSSSNEIDGPRILFVGQLRPYKGVSILIEAISSISSILKRKISLTIVGDGPQRGKLEHLVHDSGLSEHVTFLGSISDTKLHRLYLSHSVLVLPSLFQESFGIVIVEARWHGLGVIATDLPGVRDVARSLGGLVVPPSNREALVHAILMTLRSTNTVDVRPHIRKYYDWSLIGEKYSALYDKVVRPTSRSAARA